MATLSLTMNACGGSSTSQKIYYGKTSLVSGDALTGTGWTLYSGAAISASTTSVSIPSLDDNVDYNIERYCNCPTSGDTGPEILTGLIKNVCGTFATLIGGSASVTYQITVPNSLGNAGTWVDKIVVELLNAAGTTVLQSNTIVRPFSTFTTTGSFAGLTPSTAYKIRMKFSNSAGTRTFACPTSDINTKTACSAPNVVLSNVGATSLTINWTVSSNNPGDTYNIIKNGTTIASGLPISASPYTLTGLTQNTIYQIGVQRNCGTSGTATGQASAYTTNAPSIIQTCNVLTGGVRQQCWVVGDSVYPGNRFVMTVYGLAVTYVSIPGDNKYDVASQLAAAINAVTPAQWAAAPNPPPVGFFEPLAVPGIPPNITMVTEVDDDTSMTAAAFVS